MVLNGSKRKRFNITIFFGTWNQVLNLGVFITPDHGSPFTLFKMVYVKSEPGTNGRRSRPQWVKPVLKTMAATAARYYASRAHQQLLRGQTQSSEPLTGQFDYKTDYRKRRVPYRKRKFLRKKRKFNRRIIRTIRNANTGTTHIVRNSLFRQTSLVNLSSHTSFGLCGLDGFGTGDSNQACDDISQFLREKDPTGWANFETGAIPDYKLYVMHATMEVTIKNNGNADAIIEAYFIRGRRALRKTVADAPGQCYERGFSHQPIAIDPDTGATYDSPLADTTIGTTPFQCSLFCRNFKIYKRTKFRMPPGNEISLTIHSRGGVFNVSGTKGYTTDRRYHGIFFQQQGSPYFDMIAHKAAASDIIYLSVRRYRLKFVQNTIVNDAFEITDP